MYQSKFIYWITPMFLFLTKPAFCADPIIPNFTQDMVTQGKTLYKANCVSCHGENADGNGPAGKYLSPHPRNFKTDKLKKGDSPMAIFQSVTRGLEGTAMPGFATLTESERWNLVSFVKSLRER